MTVRHAGPANAAWTRRRHGGSVSRSADAAVARSLECHADRVRGRVALRLLQVGDPDHAQLRRGHQVSRGWPGCEPRMSQPPVRATPSGTPRGSESRAPGSRATRFERRRSSRANRPRRTRAASYPVSRLPAGGRRRPHLAAPSSQAISPVSASRSRRVSDRVSRCRAVRQHHELRVEVVRVGVTPRPVRQPGDPCPLPRPGPVQPSSSPRAGRRAAARASRLRTESAG